MSKSTIEWTDVTWNPVTGCTKVSEGCRSCYAERMAHQLHAMGQKRYANEFKVTCHTEALDEPRNWRKPRRVFVCSMSDLFHHDVPFEFIDKVFAVMALCQSHTFQVLTKRPERMKEYLLSRWAIDESNRVDRSPQWYAVATSILDRGAKSMPMGAWDSAHDNMPDPSLPLPNVWLGTSCEDQATADERIPHLLRCPGVRFLSLEPLLGPIDLLSVPAKSVEGYAGLRLADMLHWVIVGGESGPGARPMHPDWARSLRDQCQSAGVPFFFKQWGEWVEFDCKKRDAVMVEGTAQCGYYCNPSVGHVDHRARPMKRVGKKAAGRELDGRTWDEMPREKQ